jgi:predicted HTH transcriptional regulator
MNSDQLEQLIEGQQETDSVEFKAAMLWDHKSLIKDILALSNTIDGGVIIIGIEDRTFHRQGVTQEMIDSYDIDIMKDQVAPFADPRVVFSKKIVQDLGGLDYVVIEVSTFDDLPVICARDGTGLHAGTIYFRSRSARPASARVSNSSDLREILEASIVRRTRQLRRTGFVLAKSSQHDFESELGGL